MPDNTILPLRVTPSLINITKVFSEKDMQNHQENSILNDSISIVKQINNTSEEIFTVSSFLLLFTVEVEKFNLYFFFTSIITYFFRKVSPIFLYKNTL